MVRDLTEEDVVRIVRQETREIRRLAAEILERVAEAKRLVPNNVAIIGAVPDDESERSSEADDAEP